MQELQVGQTVLHSGTEKTIAEIHGDVVILSDNSCVNSEGLAYLPIPEAEIPENEHLAQTQTDERAALRRNIEELNEESIAVSVFSLMQQVDPSITIATLESMTVEAMKKKLLHIAVTTSKVDPKKCRECGQVVPE